MGLRGQSRGFSRVDRSIVFLEITWVFQINKISMNLNEYLKSAGCKAPLASIILDLAECGKEIINAIQTTETGEKLHSENSSGEVQMALDVLSNNIITETLT